MQRAIVLALLLDLSVGAFGTECSAGYKLKATLTGLTCETAKTDAASCNADCCEADVTKCGGLNVACGGGKYRYGAKATKAEKKAWEDRAATEKTASTACCTAKAKCSSKAYTCPPGYKYKVLLTLDCTSDAASCAVGDNCCQKDDKTCGGITAPTCDAAKGLLIGSGEGWKGTKIASPQNNLDKQKAACCGVKPTCASKLYSCPAGYKKNDAAGIKDHVCQKLESSSCADTTAWAFNGATKACCKKDDSKCGGLGMSASACPADKYYPSSLATKYATDTNKVTSCCVLKATCAVATCLAGFKKKLNVDTLSCTGDASTCASTTCCEADTAKCGGLTGISCATGFYDERTTWTTVSPDKSKDTPKAEMDAWKNKPATEATKNTACCTAKAVCTAAATVAPGATTTPAAAAVTTTPATPGLKFSEHKAALEKGSNSQGMNMVWLAVGGFIGMSVLMVVQRLRSRMQDSTEVDAVE